MKRSVSTTLSSMVLVGDQPRLVILRVSSRMRGASPTQPALAPRVASLGRDAELAA